MAENNIETFQESKKTPDADQKFKDWMERYPDGYYLTPAGKGKVRLHRVGCGHIKNQNQEMNLARNKKICHPHRQPLIDWARQHLGTDPILCKDCKL